jgi:hypothetical protein
MALTQAIDKSKWLNTLTSFVVSTHRPTVICGGIRKQVGATTAPSSIRPPLFSLLTSSNLEGYMSSRRILCALFQRISLLTQEGALTDILAFALYLGGTMGILLTDSASSDVKLYVGMLYRV